MLLKSSLVTQAREAQQGFKDFSKVSTGRVHKNDPEVLIELIGMGLSVDVLLRGSISAA